MKTNSLFNLAIKIFGIYFFVQALLLLPQWFAMVVSALSYSSFMQLITLSVSLSGMAFMDVLLGWLFTRYSRRITDYFVSPDEDCSIAIPPRSVISIALIFLGGWLITKEIPEFFNQFSAKIFQPRFDKHTFGLIGSLLRLTIGVVLIFFHRQIAEFIDRYAK